MLTHESLSMTQKSGCARMQEVGKRFAICIWRGKSVLGVKNVLKTQKSVVFFVKLTYTTIYYFWEKER